MITFDCLHLRGNTAQHSHENYLTWKEAIDIEQLFKVCTNRSYLIRIMTRCILSESGAIMN